MAGLPSEYPANPALPIHHWRSYLVHSLRSHETAYNECDRVGRATAYSVWPYSCPYSQLRFASFAKFPFLRRQSLWHPQILVCNACRWPTGRLKTSITISVNDSRLELEDSLILQHAQPRLHGSCVRPRASSSDWSWESWTHRLSLTPSIYCKKISVLDPIQVSHATFFCQDLQGARSHSYYPFSLEIDSF